MSFKCVIVTPEQQMLDESINQAIIPAHDGLVGIETNRAPLLVKLGQGPMQLDGGSGKTHRVFYVEGGIAQMKNNRLTVLTQVAVPSDQIRADTARAELAEATAQRITDEKSFADRQRRMTRARVMQQLATK